MPDSLCNGCSPAWWARSRRLLLLAPIAAACRSSPPADVRPQPVPSTTSATTTRASPDANRGCQSPVSQRTSDAGCWLTIETALGPLTETRPVWHLYSYPTSAAAEAARGTGGTVTESFGRH